MKELLVNPSSPLGPADHAAALDSRGLPRGYNFKPDWEITPRETAELLKLPAGQRPLLVDVRSDDELALCRIAGSIHLPLNAIEHRADELESDDAGHAHPIIIHCHHGVRSLKATGALRALGFTNVRSMAGGIDLWSVSVDAGVPRY